MSIIIGSKDKFAIEYEITSIYKNSSISAKVLIWIEDLYIGCFKIDFIIHHFNAVLMAKKDNFNSTNSQLMEEITSSQNLDYLFNEWNEYIYMLVSSFDEFGIRILNNSEKVIFIWKLYKDFFGGHKNYPKGVQLKIIDKREFDTVVQKYIESLPEGIAP